MWSLFVTTFREGLEAFLIVALMSLYLQQIQASQLLKAVKYGVITALILSIGIAAVLMQLGGLSPLAEGGLALFAMVLVIGCINHLRKMGKQMKQEIQEQLQKKQHSFWAVFGFTVLMITREGLETSVVLASLAQNVATLPLLKAGIVGFILAAAIGFLWIKYGKKVPLTLFFKWSSAFLWVFSIQLGIYAFHEVMEWGMETQAYDFGGMIDYTFWHDITEAYAPSGKYGQYVSLMMLLFPVLFIHHYWKNRSQNKTMTANNMNNIVGTAS